MNDLDPNLVRQYGERFAQAHADHYAAVAVIQEFAEEHSLYIDDPAHPRTENGPRWTIRNPEPHTLTRDGDMLGCVECGVSIHAPSPPKRPLTPMEASLSRFD
jgi:hypothetical protein